MTNIFSKIHKWRARQHRKHLDKVNSQLAQLNEAYKGTIENEYTCTFIRYLERRISELKSQRDKLAAIVLIDIKNTITYKI